MASDGDTITYAYTGSVESEDVSSIDEITIDYIKGAGGGDGHDEDIANADGGHGGLVENVEVDVSAYNYLYIWVATRRWGRYDGQSQESANEGHGAGSTEVAFINTDASDSSNEDVIAGAGGGGGGGTTSENTFGMTYDYYGGDGARGRDAQGTVDRVEGGAGSTSGANPGDPGHGYVETSKTEIIDSGSTTTGGGSANMVDGEVQISYFSLDAPTNVHFDDTSTEDELTLDWDEVSGAAGYYVYRAESSGSTTSDYTQVADLAADTTSYTDTAIEDGEQYFYRVSAYNTSGESDLSNEAGATTVLPAPSNVSLDDSVSGELTVSWTNNDDSTDGSITVERAPLVGVNWSSIATGLSTTTTSYTDTTISDATEYKYRIIRSTDHATAKSGDKPYRYYPRVTIT